MARKLDSLIPPTELVIDWDGYQILEGDVGVPGWSAGEWWQAPPHFFDPREMESLVEPARFKNAAFYGL